MTMPPIDKTFVGTMKDWLMRLTIVERRLAINGGGGGGSAYIAEGPGIDVTGSGTVGDPFVISAEAPALPAPVRYAPGTTHTSITATAWGTQLPGTTVQSVTIPRRMWARVTLGAWMVSSAGETRAGIRLDGATVVSPPSGQQGGTVGSGAWGQTLFLTASDTGSSTGAAQRTMSRVYLLEPGTTLFTIEAYYVTAGTHAVNYPVLEITPMYWDGLATPTGVPDTGWVDISSAVPDGGVVNARRQNDMVEIRGTAMGMDIPTGTGSVNFIPVGGLPDQFRPEFQFGLGHGYIGGMSMAVYARPDGSMAVSNRNAVSISTDWIFGAVYFGKTI